MMHSILIIGQSNMAGRGFMDEVPNGMLPNVLLLSVRRFLDIGETVLRTYLPTALLQPFRIILPHVWVLQ